MGRARISGAARRLFWPGGAATLAYLVLVEAARHGPLALPYPFPETLLVAALIPVALAGYAGGFPTGLVSATLLSLYGFVFFGSVGTADPFTMDSLVSVALLASLAYPMTGATAILRRRRDRLFARLTESKDSLAEANRDLEQANAALRAVNDSLQAFTFALAHDLKEPVRAVDAYLGEARGRLADPEARAALDEAWRANERVAGILESLVDVTKAARIDPRELRAVDVAAMLADPRCLARYATLARERHAVVDIEVAARTPRVLATEGHVCQFLGHLVNNAVLHNPRPEPHVRVRAGPSAGAALPQVEIVVEDDGPGFHRNALDAVGHMGPGRERDGVGFGLVVVRRAVERLGGRLWVDRASELGGAAVHVLLPAAG